jgi:hypothetical protein
LLDPGATRVSANKKPLLTRFFSESILGNHFSSLINGAWILLVLFNLSILLVGTPAYYKRLSSMCLSDCAYFQLSQLDALALGKLHLSLPFYASYMTGLTFFAILASLFLASTVFWRKSRTGMAVFMSFALVALGPTFFAVLAEALTENYPLLSLPVRILQAFGVWSLVIFCYLFPNGHFYPRGTYLFAFLLAIPAVAFLFNSITSILLANSGVGLFILLVMVVALLAGIVAQILRYKNISGPVEHQQVKWVVFGISFLAFGATVYAVSPLIFPLLREPGILNLLYYLIAGTFNVLCLLLFFSSFAIAILRYRLWDIDILIHRTLVYGSLTAALVVIYLSSIIFFTEIFRSITGGSSQVAIVISTLGISALFNPLRHRIQNLIDRRFYRQKYDSEKIMSTFSITLRNEVDLNRLSNQLIVIVQETMHPESISLWIK